MSIILIILGGIGYYVTVHVLKREQGTWIWQGVSFSGLILLIQSSFIPLYTTYISMNHRVDFFSSVLNSLFTLFGVQHTADNGLIYVRAFDNIYPFIITWEGMGFYLWINILIGAFVLFLFFPKIRKIVVPAIVFFVISGLYLILRYAVLVVLFTETLQFDVFWSPMVIFLSFIPFALLLFKFCRLQPFTFNLDAFESFRISKRHVIIMLLVFVLVFSIVGVYGFQDPGAVKGGRVLLDEVHSDWESSLRPMDKEWYGKIAVYNYYSLSEWLKYYYSVDKNVNRTLTNDLLQNYDILILKCPTKPYSAEEITAVKQFVTQGGGLFLIGDHTNVFGMNYYLNQVAKQFGISFDYDATYNLTDGMWTIYEPPKLLPHPIVQNLDKYYFLTSCSVQAPLFGCEPVIIGYSIQAHPGTYSNENFFRQEGIVPDITYGQYVQAVAVKYGKGRIQAFTDSTDFSNYCMFMDGYPTYFLGSMNYLNRTNVYDFMNYVLVIVTICGLVLLLYLFKKEKKFMSVFIVVTVGLLSFSVAVPTYERLNSINYVLLPPITNYTKICFDQDHSDIRISSRPAYYPMYMPNLEVRGFDTFFVWTQRVGCIPSLEKNLDDALQKGDVVVIINPIKPFSTSDISKIQWYLIRGGKMIVMDSLYNNNSTANDLLNPLNMQISKFNGYLNTTISSTYHNDLSLFHNNTIYVDKTIQPEISVSGGKTILTNEENQPILAVTTLGKGTLVVFVDSYTFSNAILGSTFSIPDEKTRKIYNLEYYLFESLLQDKTIQNPADITGVVYADENNNGQYDPASDHPIVNASVTAFKIDIIGNVTQQKYSIHKEVSVNQTGQYSLTNMTPGYYQVNVSLHGFVLRKSIQLFSSGRTFYNISKPVSAVLKGIVYYDMNGNNFYDTGEEINGTFVELFRYALDKNATRIDTMTTGKNGSFLFSSLNPDYYMINATKINATTGYLDYGAAQFVSLQEDSTTTVNISVKPVPVLDFTFDTANAGPHPPFILENLTNGPLLLEYRTKNCPFCDALEPTLQDVLGTPIENDTFVTRINISNSMLTFIRIIQENATGELNTSFSTYDLAHIGGYPMLVFLTLGNHNGTIEPCYATAYGALSLNNDLARKTFLRNMVMTLVHLYTLNHANYEPQP
jgi:thiol-disulfide isomerase/thioredoxin